MALLIKDELEELIPDSRDNYETGKVLIDPLLSRDQIGSISVDLRLGYDFLVSVVSNKASIRLEQDKPSSSPEAFFQPTRRDIGDKFLLHPSQTVLATSLEYVALPDNVYAEISSRSSFHRLGVSISSMFQPGFRGCISLELFNHSNIPIELIVGSRLVQARFYKTEKEIPYNAQKGRRKYIAQVRPTVSRAPLDKDIVLLKKISNSQ